jgi:hypothetical protein
VKEWLASSRIPASSQRMTLSGLVIVGEMQVIVPLIAALVFGLASVLPVTLDSAACILGPDNVLKVPFIPTHIVPQTGC